MIEHYVPRRDVHLPENAQSCQYTLFENYCTWGFPYSYQLDTTCHITIVACITQLYFVAASVPILICFVGLEDTSGQRARER